jgi:methylated-DNA-[protein]-cysteine S-methyltransferase
MKTNPGSSPFVAQARIETPLGPLTATATAHGLAGLWFDAQSHHPGDLTAPVGENNPFINKARRELAAYWKDGRTAFTVPLDLQGTPFQQSVWRLLRGISPGQLESYGAMATRLGQPKAARAVGAAVGRNPIGIIVPCHRVVGANGALTGYAGGLDRKQALLRLEGAIDTAPSALTPNPKARLLSMATRNPAQAKLAYT